MSWQSPHLLRRIHGIYREYDRHILSFQMATGIRCPDGCGVCCQSQDVEATVLECLPLANEIFNQGKEEATLSAIDKRMERGDLNCVLYIPHRDLPEYGRCAFYDYRPLVCRLFGFAVRRNKFGQKELCLCKVAKKTEPAKSTAAETDADLTHVPDFHEAFMKISSLSPEIGTPLIPINTAIKQSLEYLYWKRPRRRKMRRAA
ncbi:MAG: YkgJ family cysteine cluster protein [Deltaproteobacteria bacterium]|nr:YkgJ family cysteine cluster protein [Deltaproteobacteria bacterium]